MSHLYKHIGSRPCPVPGYDKPIRPGDVIELRDEVMVHGLPHWPEWWAKVKDTAATPADEEVTEDD